MKSLEVPVATDADVGWTDVTPVVREFCSEESDGLVHVFAPHSTVGLALMHPDEGAGADVVAALRRLLPRDINYQRQEKAPGHGADHVVPVLVSPSVTIPVLGGALVFGEFQQIVFIDLDEVPSPRRLRLSFMRDA